jgi:hypothetical protein
MPNAPKRPFHTAADADIKSIVRNLPPPRTLRDFVLDQLRSVPLNALRRQGLRRDF